MVPFANQIIVIIIIPYEILLFQWHVVVIFSYLIISSRYIGWASLLFVFYRESKLKTKVNSLRQSSW